MPIYLAHGFRWPREGFTGIRVHAIVHNLEDCSVEYIQNENSRADILTSLRKAHPDIMKELESSAVGRRIDFLEQHDPDDLSSAAAVSQPYAFVCDRVLMIAGGKDAALHAARLAQVGPDGTVSSAGGAGAGAGAGARGTSPESPTRKRARAPTQPMSRAAPFNSPATCTALSVNVEEVIADGPGMSTQAWEAMADLRDKLAEGEKIGWWVVYNGDPERAYDDDEDEDEDDSEEEEQQPADEAVVGATGPSAPGGAAAAAAQPTSTSSHTKSLPQSPSPEKEDVSLPTVATIGSPRSPTGGRIPPPVPPPVPPKSYSQFPSESPRSPTNATTSPTSPPSAANVSTLPVRDRDKGLRAPGLTAATARSEQQQQPPQENPSENIPEPTKLKEAAKAQGLRKKFFGKRA